LLALGDLYGERGDHEAAIACYERGLGKYPEVDGLWLSLGISLEEVGRTGEAEAAYRQAHDINGENLTAVIRLGHLLRKAGRTGEMMTLMGEAVRENPELLEMQPYLRNFFGPGAPMPRGS
jgi:tetratricopeptide (TPR) repeat protein